MRPAGTAAGQFQRREVRADGRTAEQAVCFRHDFETVDSAGQRAIKLFYCPALLEVL